MRKTNKSKKDQVKKLPQLQKLQLEQLESVVGSSGDPEGEVPDESPDGVCIN